jgi:Protein of unknown function (Hypoth_ymh)
MSFESIDKDRVCAELSRYVDETTPGAWEQSDRFGSVTRYIGPRCERSRAIELTERVRPILDGLFPEWRDEVKVNDAFEFGQVRDACERLRARIASSGEIGELLAGVQVSPQLSAGALHPSVWSAASAHWNVGHRHEAVLAAAKAINSLLQAKVQRRDVSEVALVQEAFSSGKPQTGKPRLRFPQVEDDKTRESITQGALSFGVGCFQAIRNPVGHLLPADYEFSEQEALERLAALSLFARWIEDATVVVQDSANGN